MLHNATGGGVDYDSGPYTVTFLAGEIHALLNVLIHNDAVLENDEIFTLTIDPSSTPDSVSGSQAIVTIVDNDRK